MADALILVGDGEAQAVVARLVPDHAMMRCHLQTTGGGAFPGGRVHGHGVDVAVLGGVHGAGGLEIHVFLPSLVGGGRQGRTCDARGPATGVTVRPASS